MSKTAYIASNGAWTTDTRGFCFSSAKKGGGWSGPHQAWQDYYGHYNGILFGWLEWGDTFSSTSPVDDEWRTSGNYYENGGYDPLGSISATTAYEIGVSSNGGGTMSGNGDYLSGANVTITATPNSGYLVAELNGVDYRSNRVSGSRTSNFNASSDKTVEATFAKYYNIKFYKNTTADDTTTANQNLNIYGTTYSLKTLATLGWNRTGYKFTGWNTARDGTGSSYTDGQSISNLSSTAGATVSLYAQWDQYTLTYSANGGSSTPAAKVGYGSITLAGAITYAGHRFDGWKIGGVTYAAGASYNLAANATATAQWTAYTVSYNAEGGSACTGGSGVVQLPSTTKTGYVLQGWYTAESGGTRVGGEGDSYTPTANVTLYAHWKAKTYSFTFKPNGGKINGEAADYTVPNSASTTKPTYGQPYYWRVANLAVPSRTGYVFQGWYTAESDGSQVWDASGVCTTNGGYWSAAGEGATLAHSTSDDGATLSFHAQWSGEEYTFNINPNGGTYSGLTIDGKLIFGTGNYVTLANYLCTRTGYAFAGYYTAASGGVKVWGADGKALKGDYWTDTADNSGKWKMALGDGATFTAYAHWTAKQSALTFSANGGSGTMTTGKKATYGAAMPSGVTLPTRTGYSFAGFYDAASEGTKYYNADGTSAKAWDKDTTAGTTLYAHWTANTYYIDYDLNGGGTRNPTQAAYDAVVTVAAPTRTNYIFAGWSVSNYNSSEAKWDKTDNPTTAITANTRRIGDAADAAVYVKNLRADSGNSARAKLTAQWTQREYTITARANSYRFKVELCRSASFSGDVIEIPARVTNVESRTFTAHPGETWHFRMTLVAAEQTISSWYYPLKYGKSGSRETVSRVAGSEENSAVFRGSHTFSDSEDLTQTWEADIREVKAKVSTAAGANPFGETIIPTIRFDDGSTTNVRITAGETTKSEFVQWSDISPNTALLPSGGTTSGDRTVVLVTGGESNVSLWSNYKRRDVAVAAAVHSATAVAVPNLTATVASTASGSTAGATANIGYGTDAVWTFGGTVPTGYAFAGWYDANGVLQSESMTYTRTNITTPTTLYARLTAEVTFHVEAETVTNGPTVAGGISVNGGGVFPESSHTERYLLGETLTIRAVPGNDASYFAGWFSGATKTGATRLAGYAAEAQHYVGSKADLLAYFTATPEMFYVAVYGKDLISGFTLGLMIAEAEEADETEETEETDETTDSQDSEATAVQNGVVSLTKTEYEEATGYTAAATSGEGAVYNAAAFYKVTGIRRVDSVTTRTTSTDDMPVAVRVMRGLPNADGTVHNPAKFSDGTPFAAVIDADCCFVAEFEAATTKTLTLGVVLPASGPAGGTAIVENAVTTTDGGRQGVYETGSTAVAVAVPSNGYTFAGWYSSSEGTGDPVSTASRYEFAVSANTTLYAKFARGSFALYRWEGADVRKQLRWKSKVYALSKPANLTSVRVDASTLNAGQPAYPVARFKSESFSSPDSAATSTVDFAEVSTDGGTVDSRLQGQTMRRLPARRPERYFQVEVQAAAEIDAIIIGTNGEGLAT